MDLKKLLDLKYVDMDQVREVIKNRDLLLLGTEDYLTPDFYSRFSSTEVNVLNYYSGDAEVIKKLIPFSNKTNIPIFPSDVIEIENKFNRIEQFKSAQFFLKIMDALVEIQGYPSGDNNLLNLYNIKRIKIIKQEKQEIFNLIKDLEHIDGEKESLYIELQFVELINNLNSSFNGEKFYKDLRHVVNNFYIRDLSENGQSIVLTYLRQYFKTGNIFSLLEAIKIISNHL